MAEVMGLLERRGGGQPEVRAKIVHGRRKCTIQAEARANVDRGSHLYADAFASYSGLAGGYIHEVIDHSEAYVRDRVSTNGLENFWSLFKRALYGTHHAWTLSTSIGIWPMPTYSVTPRTAPRAADHLPPVDRQDGRRIVTNDDENSQRPPPTPSRVDFEVFTRRILAVPKAKVDAKVAQEHERRRRNEP